MRIHINTLHYRFSWIQSLVLGAFDDGHFRFELQLALELWNIHQAEWSSELSLVHPPPSDEPIEI